MFNHVPPNITLLTLTLKALPSHISSETTDIDPLAAGAQRTAFNCTDNLTATAYSVNFPNSALFNFLV